MNTRRILFQLTVILLCLVPTVIRSQAQDIELLTTPWTNMVASNGAVEQYQSIDQWILSGKEGIRVSIDLHGATILGGDASALIFDQNGWNYISLSNYVQQGYNGVQVVDIPLVDFGLDLSQPVGTLHTRFWSENFITIDISSIVAYGETVPTSTIPPSATWTTTPTSTDSPTPTTANFDDGLITNGSFENLNGNWVDGWNNSAAVSIDMNSQGNHGSNSLYIAPSPDYVSVSSWGFSIDNTKSYIWSQHIKIDSGTGYLGFIIDEYGSNWNYLSGQNFQTVSSNTLETVSFNYTPSSNAVANVSVQYYVSGATFNIWIDSVSFTDAEDIVISPTVTTVATTQAPTVTPDISLPPIWSSTDIGSVGVTGSSALIDGRFILRGSGTDIWNNGTIQDEFYFVYQALVGDGEIVAQITEVAMVNEWTKAGLMFKESLAVGSNYVLIADTRDHDTAMQWGFTETTHDTFGNNPPYWLRLARLGNTFSGYASSDGVNWVLINQTSIAMDELVYVGMFLSSHNNSELASATFENVVLQPLISQNPTSVVPILTWTPTSQPIPSTPTPTPLPPIQACPTGVGPNGITANDYPAGKLTQDERQWLFNIFGNSGVAPIGYGGEVCGTRIEDPYVNFNNFICSKGWTGPEGLPLGSYPAGRLRNDQRQWLYESFRNQGLAPVGFGGEMCPGNYSNSEQNFFRYVCNRGLVGPGGITPNEYGGQPITQQQREWLWDVFMEDPGGNSDVSVGFNGHHCPGQIGDIDANYLRRARVCASGATGPYGMIPGNYNVDDLTYEERAWLYYIFENTGDVPVGYGGETCPYQTVNYASPNRSGPYNPNLPLCPSGVGEPGSYEPQSLTQQQRNELWIAFGHTGEAPVGYGGVHCQGGTMTLTSFTNTSGDSQNPPPDGGITAPLYYGSTEPIGEISARITAEAGLNIRDGRGTNYEIVGSAVYNQWFQVISGPIDGWYEIRMDSQQGWVNGQFTEIAYVRSYADSLTASVLVDCTVGGVSRYLSQSNINLYIENWRLHYAYSGFPYLEHNWILRVPIPSAWQDSILRVDRNGRNVTQHINLDSNLSPLGEPYVDLWIDGSWATFGDGDLERDDDPNWTVYYACGSGQQ